MVRLVEGTQAAVWHELSRRREGKFKETSVELTVEEMAEIAEREEEPEMALRCAVRRECVAV
jgi:hypothetical protein